MASWMAARTRALLVGRDVALEPSVGGPLGVEQDAGAEQLAHLAPVRAHAIQHLRTRARQGAQLPLRLAQGLLGRAAARDVDEGHHGAVDPVLHGPVGTQPHDVPAPVPAHHLALDRDELRQQLSGIALDGVVVELMGEVRDGPPDVRRRDVEDAGDGRREHADAQVAIEEQRAHFGRRRQVLEVAVGGRDAFELALHLGVDGVELLVDGLQLFLRGFQFLRGRAVLLVHGLQLLVGGAQILDGGFVVVAAGDERFLGGPELGVEAAHLVGLHVVRRRRPLPVVDGAAVQEEHQRVPPRALVLLDRHHVEGDAAPLPVEGDLRRMRQGRQALFGGAREGEFEVEPQLRPHHGGQDVGDGPAGMGDEAPRRRRQVQDVVPVVHERARRRALFEGRHMQGGRQAGLLGAQLRDERLARGREPLGRGVLRQDRQQLDGFRARHVDAGLAIERREQVRGAVHRLGRAQEQAAAELEAVMEDGVDLLLQRPLHVDEQVAAADQVEPHEGRLLQHAVGREQHQFAQVLADAVMRALVDEEAAEPLLGHVGLDGARIAAFPRHGERALVEVRGEDLDGDEELAPAHLLEEQHGDAVGLLARGAAHHPAPDALLAFRIEGVEQRLDGVPVERLEGACVAEEARDRDQQVAEQLLGLLGVDVEMVRVARQRVEAADLHPPQHAAHHGRALVAREIVARAGAQEGHDAPQVVGGAVHVERADRFFAVGDLAEAIDQPRDGCDEVDGAARDGVLRHGAELGLGRLLRHHHPPRLLDGTDAQGAVRPRARQDDGDAVAARRRDRAEEQVDRRPTAAGFAEGACRHAVAVDDEFTIGRDHEDAVALQRRPVLDEVDRHRGAERQDPGERARLVRGEVQDDHVGEAEIRREVPEQRLQRRDPARRGADGADRDETGGQGDLRLLLVHTVHAVRSSAQKRRRSTGLRRRGGPTSSCSPSARAAYAHHGRRMAARSSPRPPARPAIYSAARSRERVSERSPRPRRRPPALEVRRTAAKDGAAPAGRRASVDRGAGPTSAGLGATGRERRGCPRRRSRRPRSGRSRRTRGRLRPATRGQPCRGEARWPGSWPRRRRRDRCRNYHGLRFRRR